MNTKHKRAIEVRFDLENVGLDEDGRITKGHEASIRGYHQGEEDSLPALKGARLICAYVTVEAEVYDDAPEAVAVEPEAAAVEPTPTPRIDAYTPTQQAIVDECDALKALLLTKNRAYGNSALDPVRVFSTAATTEQIRVRIDDKLSRLKRGAAAGEDVTQDLMGYLVLLRIAERGVAL